MTVNAPPLPAPVTLDLIAREAGVSPSTVSRFLNGTARISDAKRVAVEETIARFKFQPNSMARALALGQTMSIGVLTQYIDSPFYGEALRGIEDELEGSGYVPLFVSGHWNPVTEVARMAVLHARKVDGIIVLTGRLSDQQLLDYAERMPIVVTGRELEGPNLVSLHVDDFDGARQATRHLIELGHTQIAFIGGLDDRLDALARLHGYQQAFADAGLEIVPGLIVHADFLESGGLMAINKLLEQREHFSAVFAANDQMAYGVRLALHRRNIRVPEDVSLVGYDDLPNSVYSVPPLTTVRQPVYEIGRSAAAAMLDLIGGKRTITGAQPVSLVVRESTRRLRR